MKKQYFCIDCHKTVSDREHKRCLSCAGKNRYKSQIERDKCSRKGKDNPMYGVHRYGKESPGFKFDISKEELIKLYIEERKTQKQVGKVFGCSEVTIRNNLIKYKIPIRTISESCKGCIGTWKGKHLSEETKQLLSKQRLGKKHPERCGHNNPACRPEVREKMSKARKGRKLTQEWKDNIKKATTGTREGIKNTMYGKSGKLSPRYGKRAILGHKETYRNIKMFSSWEVKYAQYLDKNNVKWEYEPKTFDLGESTYTPDFYLPEQDKYIEIKGYFTDYAKNKINIFRQLYANINYEILEKQQLKDIGVL